MPDQPPSPWALAGQTFRGVLLDMDSTLIDSVAAVNRSWVRWASDMGVDPALLEGNHGVPARGTIERLLPADRHAAGMERIRVLEEGDTEGIVVLPGSRAALTALAGARVAVVTSCTRALADARLAASGLIPPDVVVTADDVSAGKPNPEPYLVGAERLEVPIEECLVVEDAPAGLIAGRHAGCAAVLGLTTTHTAEDVGRLADAVVGTLDDVRFVVAADGGVTVEPARP